MSDPEVARLRRLRNSALRVRTIALALGSTPWASNDSSLRRAACASWRIARTVSGRLKGHPYARYQKGASVGCLLRNFVLARFVALMARSRTQTLLAAETHLRRLLREVDDARALTWLPDLSDAFGRSQVEIKSLLAAWSQETRNASALARLAKRELPLPEMRVDELSPQSEGDWPYLAF